MELEIGSQRWLGAVIGVAVGGWSTAPHDSSSKHSHGVTILASVGAGDVSAAGSGLVEPAAYFGAIYRWVAKQVGRAVNWVKRNCDVWLFGFQCHF